MSVTLLGSLLLAVSLVSVVIYMAALGQLLTHQRQPGLLRTATCRLFAALLYVAVGLITVVTNEKGPLIGLGVFTVVQLIWQVNSVADVLLVRKKRRTQVSEFDPPGVTDPVPNYAQPLSDFVASAEINKLFEKHNKLEQSFVTAERERESADRRQQYWRGLSVFTTVLAICGLVFGLITFNRADQADELGQQNQVIIQDNRKLIDELRGTQALLATSIRESCVLYSQFLATYDRRARAASSLGPERYDSEYRRMFASSENLKCGLTRPSDLPH